jgi:hypothetical protein
MAADRDPTRISVIVCIDAEPDQFFTDRRRAEAWRGLECAFDFFRALRRSSESDVWRQGRLNWFFRMDPQVAETYGSPEWPLRHYERAVAELEARGDPIGLHVHAYRWSAAHNSWLTDFENQAWIDHCLSVSFDAYRNVIGRPCQAFRFGDRWMNNETAQSLETRGVLYDLTLEPGLLARRTYFPNQPSTGGIPDYSRVPVYPYRAARNDFRVPCAEAIGARHELPHEMPQRTWMVPITTAPARLSLTHRAARRVMKGESGAAVTTAAVASIYPNVFRQVVNAALTRQRPYLAVAVRTDVFVNQRARRRVEENLDNLLSHPFAPCFALTSPADALAALELQNETSSPVVAAI